MNANELRIGNLVEQEFPGYRYPQDATWGQHVIEAKDLAEEEFDKLFRAIKLTEEWLRKFGFEERAYKWYYKSWLSDQSQDDTNEIVIGLLSGRCNVSTAETEETGAYTAKRILHVHQLQNLYYALTGEELTLAA